MNEPALDLTVTQARLEDVELLIEMREEAARWLAEKGSEQWPVGLFPRLTHYITERVTAGEEYLVCDRGAPIGTLRLQASDEEMWPEAENDAFYVHGLVVRRAYAGRRIGLWMLRWAEDRAAAAAKLFLRLDCVAHNPRLVRYYEEAGFLGRGQIESRWGGGATLHQRFEKRVGP